MVRQAHHERGVGTLQAQDLVRQAHHERGESERRSYSRVLSLTKEHGITTSGCKCDPSTHSGCTDRVYSRVLSLTKERGLTTNGESVLSKRRTSFDRLTTNGEKMPSTHELPYTARATAEQSPATTSENGLKVFPGTKSACPVKWGERNALDIS